MKIDILALLLASGLAVIGIEANGEGVASGQSGSVVRTQAQVFGDALNSSDPSNGGFWTISADRPAQTVSVASASKGDGTFWDDPQKGLAMDFTADMADPAARPMCFPGKLAAGETAWFRFVR